MMVKLDDSCFDQKEGVVREVYLDINNWYLHNGESPILCNQYIEGDHYHLSEYGYRRVKEIILRTEGIA